MAKCRLIELKTSIKNYKGEIYMRANLKFEIIYFGFYKTYKTIIYDVTMFEDFKSHEEYWKQMISSKLLVEKSIIKNRKIF